MSARVVVTGMGVISPLGNSINYFWNSIKNGENGIQKISQFDSSNYDVNIAGECDIDLNDYLDKKELNKIDRFTAFAIIAAQEAINDAELNNIDINRRRTGVIVGSGIGGMHTFEKQLQRLIVKV